MKNPANPGDFGTNGTRGVVLSGMYGTTTSPDYPIGISVSITQICGRQVTEFERLTYARYAIGEKMRTADGCTEREITNSPSEIGWACTGRKMALALMLVCALMVCLNGLSAWLSYGWSAALNTLGVAFFGYKLSRLQPLVVLQLYKK